MTNIFKMILDELPKSKIKVIADQEKDQKIADQISETLNFIYANDIYRAGILKYKLYYGDLYYPKGGQKDFRGYYESVEQAKKFVEYNYPKDECMWAHIVLDDSILVEGIIDVYEPRTWQWKEFGEP